jgi:hypothetical protein
MYQQTLTQQLSMAISWQRVSTSSAQTARANALSLSNQKNYDTLYKVPQDAFQMPCGAFYVYFWHNSLE